MRAQPFEAAIFDLDGVIVDTAKFHYKAWKRLAGELGFAFSESENEQLKGVSRMESLDLLLRCGGLTDVSPERREALASRKNEWYKELLATLTPADVLPGVGSFLGLLRSRGIKTGIASASQNAPLIIDKVNIGPLFDAVVDGNSIVRAKPDPEVFLQAARLLGVAPAACFVFEDAAAGVEGALRAGMRVVGIGNGKLLARSHLAITSFEQLEPIFLMSHIGAAGHTGWGDSRYEQ
ncbi:beta-phosphoglucomutase [Paenibacillus jilunlii]|uniref:Beta-phosphoglucomutase n=1 Tax=Paenibacillus jilunlii TaxID=682956 RepID=A0A1G9R0E9_9BACL|nr:beta-phosphoglucomutase [Paenibacillus jilunlii]KWX77285.1 beta-phosphoglucomutase [Paenibacillus jilunlii]SDM16718.1 beta-phosphoglucomutase [Paenibacillus jilunlii]